MLRSTMSDQSSYTIRAAEHGEAPLSISHLLRTLRAYSAVIGLAMAAVVVGYIIIAVSIYILAPGQRVTTLRFRLEFEGADRGQYPNGTKFSTAEIISTPVLRKTFQQNDLDRFTTFGDFARSVFVLESNADQENLAREYQARLSDQRLTSVDRERIQREYELKLSSLSKAEYSINYLRKRRRDKVPETLARKVMHDVLRNWATFVSNEQHVLEYRVAVLSPDIVAATPADGTNPVIATTMLRSKVLRVLSNIAQIGDLPNAELARTATDGLSLTDISVRLDEIVRFRLEPLIHRIAAAKLDDRAETVRFLETQLSYDERQVEAQARTAEAAQRTLAMYMNVRAPRDVTASSATGPQESRPAGAETVMPQISDTFIDRLIELTASSSDTQFRQKMADEYRRAVIAVVPLQQAVAYDRAILQLVRSENADLPMTRNDVEQTITATRSEVRQLVGKVHEIYRALSAHLNPSTELLSTFTPFTRVERGTSMKELALYGILTCLVALPLIIIFCLLHNRVREEEKEQELVTTSRDAVETPA